MVQSLLPEQIHRYVACRQHLVGTLITILFQDRPDKVFVAWVYPEGSDKKLTLRKLEAGNSSEEDIRRINVRYKKLIVDKVHAM